MDWLETLRTLRAFVTDNLGFEAVSSGAMALILVRWFVRRATRQGGVVLASVFGVLDGAFRVLIGLVVLGMAVLLAVARTAGRSHYRW